MSLETIIPPEIADCELSSHLTALARRPDVRTILEIGSSAGDGSTQAIVNGMIEVEHEQELFCVEMSNVRFEALCARYAALPWVHCFHGSSVPLSGYLTPEQVVAFYNDHETNLNQYPLKTVLEWLSQDLAALEGCYERNLIESIRPFSGWMAFEMAILDGSAFTGFAELKAVYGTKIIVLDDTNDIKHWQSRLFLASDVNYKLIAENRGLRNGYSIFERVAT
jgi:hypothetical protein